MAAVESVVENKLFLKGDEVEDDGEQEGDKIWLFFGQLKLLCIFNFPPFFFGSANSCFLVFKRLTRAFMSVIDKHPVNLQHRQQNL